MNDSTFFGAICGHADKLFQSVHGALVQPPCPASAQLWRWHFEPVVKAVMTDKHFLKGRRAEQLEDLLIYDHKTLCWAVFEPEGPVSQGGTVEGVCFFVGNEGFRVDLFTLIPSTHALLTKLTGLMGRDFDQLELF